MIDMLIRRLPKKNWSCEILTFLFPVGALENLWAPDVTIPT